MRTHAFLLTWLLPAAVRSSSSCTPNKWTDYLDLKMKYVSTSADHQHMWGISPTDDTYYKAQGGSWQLVPSDKLLMIDVSGDGNKVWAITWEGNDVYREGGIDGEWVLVVDNAKNWIDVAVSADGEHVAGIDEVGAVWDRKGFGNPWYKRTGNLKVVSYSGDGAIGWGVDFDGNVWYRADYLEKWVMVTGNLKYIEVSSDGQHVWGCNYADIVYYRKGKNDFWKGMEGVRGKQVTVSGDGSHVYATDRNNDVHYINGYPGHFQKDNRAARNLGGAKMVEVTVSESGDNIYAVDENSDAWHTTGIDFPWIKVPGAYAGVSVAKENELWAVSTNPENKIQWRSAPNTPWTQLHGTYQYVDVSADGNHVWGIHPNYMMAYREGKADLNFDWIYVDNVRAKQISVSADGSHVWYVNPNNKIHYREGREGEQQDISPELELKQISVSGDGNHVWGVNEDKQVYYRDGANGSWIEAQAPLLDYVSVNGDGSTLYGVNAETGETYYRFC